MTHVSAAHIDSILEICAQAGECSDETLFPAVVLRDMTDLFGSKSCVYYTMNQELDDRPIWNGFGYNLATEPIDAYEAHYRNLDPCFAGLKGRAASGRPLAVSTDQVIASERDYVASGYYRDFLHPQNIHSSLIFAVTDGEGALGLFGFHRARGKPHYSAEEHVKARLFAAQMAGVLRMKKVLGDLAGLRARVESTRAGELVSKAKLDEFGITPREREIVAEVSRGLTTAQIADRLDISEKTVQQHLDHLYRKTGTHNRTALIYRLSR